MSKYQLTHCARTTSFVPVVCACALLNAFGACATSAGERAASDTVPYEIVATHPHDARGLTQGLHWHDGRLVESFGGYGESVLLLRAVRDATPIARRALARSQFGEGVAGDGRRIVQLTWREGVALVYDLALRPIGRHTYEGEGWGLAWDGARWLMSDGSHRIVARDRATFERRGGFDVADRGRPVSRLNELEFAHGRLYANVWHSDRVAVIDPASGEVEAWLGLSALRKGFPKPPGWNEQEHVLNGIAFDPGSGHFFVTGKRWPVLYEIRLPARR
jgi:glutaminyl-peptide cyclotransferase